MDQQFTATLQKSPEKGGWTYVVWPGSVELFGTHTLPMKADVRKAIGKGEGDTVTVVLQERLEA